MTRPVVDDAAASSPEAPAPEGSAPRPHQVEACMVRLSAERPGFIMDLADPEGQTLSVEFPSWIVHQLMRILPRVDAALQAPADASLATVPAYPVTAWHVSSDAEAQSVALHVSDEREVEGGFRFNLEQAHALQQAVLREIERVVDAAPLPADVWRPGVN